MENAVKYTFEGDEIVATCSVSEDQLPDQRSLTISISDHGPGIDPSMLEKVFEKFERVAGDLTKSNKGLGLGLFIVKKLVEINRGKIWVEKKQQGCTVSVQFPM